MKKSIMLPFFMIGILASYPTFAYFDTFSPKIAIGTYNRQNFDSPYTQAVILHHNENDSWSTLTIPWKIPPKESEINDISCIENNCIAAPYASYSDGTSRPFFLMSADGGATWYTNSNITGLPNELKGGEPISIYRDGTISLSSGWYSTQFGTVAMLLTSFNNGESWSFSSLPSPPSGGYGAFLNPINCLDNVCTIGVAYVSDNKGLTWSSSKISGVPSNNALHINDVQCNADICIAAGKYIIDTGVNTYAHLLLLTSKDKGHSWNFIDKIRTPDINDLNIKDFVYSNGSFILVGGYTSDNNFSDYKGFILISNDNGKSWNWIEKVSGIVQNKLTTLNSISCTGNTCISGGSNDRGLNFIISHDHGLSWEIIKNITGMNEIPNIDTIQCKENVCTVFGSFYNNTFDNHIHPLSIESHDQGEAWIINKNIINFPEHLGELRFSDIE
jgi:hypothetical protein